MPYIKNKKHSLHIQELSLNILNLKAFSLKISRFFRNKKRFFTHYNSCLFDKKGKHRYYLKALAKLPHKNWHYKIIGEGSELQNLKRTCFET